MRCTRELNRAALILGAAAAGLMAATLFSMADASADGYSWVQDPSVSAEIDYTNGFPPLYQDVLGTDYFQYDNSAAAVPGNPEGLVGMFGADVSQISTPFFTNQELLVTSVDDVSVTAPPIGSVLDTVSFGNGFENIYTDLVGLGPNGTNLITDMFDTPFGDFAIPTTFDAAALTMGDLLI